MDSDVGGWLSLVIDVVFVGVLIAGLIYGTIMWRTRRRTRALEATRDHATKRLYESAAKNERNTQRDRAA
jgi:uncharacterized iron-regulated membrane protein